MSIVKGSGSEWYQNAAVSSIQDHGGFDFNSSERIGFYELAQKFGNIFIYAKIGNDTKENVFTFTVDY
jgi:hypothetical protein